MVFVYPCITSENVNRQIVPAATKSMELFFLYQLQSAFNDGLITCKQEFDHSKHMPGLLKFESNNAKSSKTHLILEKSFDALDNIKMVVTENKVIYDNNYQQPRISNDIKGIIKESQNVEEKLHTYRIELNSLLESNKNTQFRKSAKNALKRISESIIAEHQFRNLLESKPTGPEPSDDTTTGTNVTVNIKTDKDKKDSVHSKDNYQKSDNYKIDLTPTSMPLEVKVFVEDGNDPNRGKYETRTIMIGVKVVPVKIKNFNQVNDALMDDYFSKFSDNVFKSIYRSAARGIMGGFRKLLDKIGISRFLPDPIDSYYENKGDIVKQMITMAPSNFVNASAFRSNINEAPLNYKFTSSVVMFNKDDIEEDESIFMNRSAMNRLFRMGWTSFAVLDPIKEVMLFISNLDGGYLHELPYSYMFTTLNATDIYKNESSLRNGSRPFSIRKGNFATFARRV